MQVYIIEDGMQTFSTARKAIERAVQDGAGEYKVFVSKNSETGKITEFPLSSVKRAIAQLRTVGFLNAYGAGEGESLNITQRSVK